MAGYESRTPATPPTPWLERWLLVLMIILIILMAYSLVQGSNPSRKTQRVATDSATVLCLRVRDQMNNDRAAGKPIAPDTEVAFQDLCSDLLVRYRNR